MLDVLCSDQQLLDAKSLFKLNFHKNSDGKHCVCMVPTQAHVPYRHSCTTHAGKYHCPVTYKVFNENTHIVAVRTTGNVYSMEVGREWLADLTPSLPRSLTPTLLARLWSVSI